MTSIDDLDRCLPPAAIATLEAMRLFLFLKKTAFVIAADDAVIREAVRAHFKGMALNDDLVTNYFDKLIQVPIRVPPLGTQDVRAYLMMLFVENSSLPQTEKDTVRSAISERLGETWAGKRVDRAFVASQISGASAELSAHLDLADRIAPILTTSPKIAGNPRLIKRFPQYAVYSHIDRAHPEGKYRRDGLGKDAALRTLRRRKGLCGASCRHQRKH